MKLNALMGWALAVAAVVAGYALYGGPGVLLALGIVVFWLLLQFSRAMRAMRTAGESPIGQVASAVMVQSRLNKGMRLLDLVTLTRSLGDKLSDEPETYRWADNSGASVVVRLEDGLLADWVFEREPSADDATAQAAEQAAERAATGTSGDGAPPPA